MVYKKGALSRYARTGYPGSGVARKASKALYLASKVAKSLNVEKKYHDIYHVGNLSGAGAPYIALLNGVAQGDTGETRDGDQIKCLKLGIKGRVANGQAASDAYRFMIILDRQADGTAPTLAEILQNTRVNSMNNMDNKMRFKILKDKFFSIGGTSQSNTTRCIEEWVDLSKIFKKSGQGLRIRYSGTGSAVGDIASNSVWLLLFNRSGTTDGSSFDFDSRLRYVDN